MFYTFDLIIIVLLFTGSSIVTCDNYKLTLQDLTTISEGYWLNDNVEFEYITVCNYIFIL